eukprot:gene14970-20139_t
MNIQTGKNEQIFESTAANEDHSSQAQKLSLFKEELLSHQGFSETKDINTAHLTPEESFQAFNGKLFTLDHQQYSLADALERRIESPLQKYSRLRSEIESFKLDLDNMVIAEEKKASSIYSLLQTETGKLLSTAQLLQNHKGLKLVHTDIEASEQVLQHLMDQLKVATSNKGSLTNYRQKEEVAPKNSEIIDLEKRVTILEAMLGLHSNLMDVDNTFGSKSIVQNSFPLVEALTRLEGRIAMLDPASLQTIGKNTKELKSDLEAALKAKSGAQDPRERTAIEAAKRVEELYEKVQKVEAIAEDLPNLVVRFKTLEGVHLAASNFASRLLNMEEEIKVLSGDLVSNKDVLASITTGLTENMATMQANIKRVDDRILKLSK